MKTPKGILVYGAGNVGCGVTRLATELGWPVVAAVNRAGPKVGRRLAELAGCELPHDPVVRETLEEALAGREADVALFGVGDSLTEHMQTYRALMARGLHVITASVEASYPAAVSAGIAADIDAFARKHGVVFVGTGFPDIFRIGLLALLSGASTRIDRAIHTSLVDVGPHGPSVGQLSGTGLDEKAFRAAFDRKTAGRVPFYLVLLHHAVEAAGLGVGEIDCIIEPVLAARHMKIGTFEVAAGHSLGSRMVTRILTQAGFEVIGRNEIRLAEPGEAEFLEWRIEGPAPLTARVSGYDAGMSTNAQIVNRIPDVLAAAPGLRTAAELGPPRFPGSARSL